ncbi:MAG: regulator, partial [Ideonella sp.]|nr:regulator [Ideonella sp.]
MAIGLRAAGIGLIALGTALAGAYQLGRQQTAQTIAQAPPVAAAVAPAAATASLPAGHPPAAAPQREGKATPDPGSRFTHFRVGNKNVKRLFVDGDTVWVGTSGGVVRYDTRS